MARATGAKVDHVAAARGFGQGLAPAHVVRNHPHVEPGPEQGLAQVADGVLQDVHQRFVAQVGPPVVHVQHGHVDHARIGGRHVAVLFDPRELETADVGPGRARGQAGTGAMAPTMGAVERHKGKIRNPQLTS